MNYKVQVHIVISYFTYVKDLTLWFSDMAIAIMRAFVVEHWCESAIFGLKLVFSHLFSREKYRSTEVKITLQNLHNLKNFVGG